VFEYNTFFDFHQMCMVESVPHLACKYRCHPVGGSARVGHEIEQSKLPWWPVSRGGSKSEHVYEV
jgi:hypothetical protein